MLNQILENLKMLTHCFSIPDISNAISSSSEFNNCYTETHRKYARYSQGPKNKYLTFTENGCNIEGYSDAD